MQQNRKSTFDHAVMHSSLVAVPDINYTSHCYTPISYHMEGEFREFVIVWLWLYVWQHCSSVCSV